MRQIEIAKDFSDVPSGRNKSDGPFSGEAFRDKLLAALKTKEKVEIVLDGVEGYGSSFLEEAFGGLVRVEGFSQQQLHDRLIITANTAPYKSYIREIWSYIDDARPAATIR